MNSRNSRWYVAMLAMCVLTVVVLAACGPVTAKQDRLAGTWAGAMSFSDDPDYQEDIQVIIPKGCAAGAECGYIINTSVNCKWEMRLVRADDQTFQYEFSKTLSGECPAAGGGTLTLQPDGRLWREHQTPMFTAMGPLTRIDQ